MKHAPKTHFDRPAADGQSQPITMRDVVALAKTFVADMTALTPDAVAQCNKGADGQWTVVVDVIESPARMGDNDLLAAYEVAIGPDGDMAGFKRLRRYHREDQGA